MLRRPAAAVDRDAARRRLKGMLRGNRRYTGLGPEPSDDELMRMVVEDIKDARRRDRGSGSR